MTRVLIVDDDVDQLRLLHRSIATRRRDLAVITADDGARAISLLRETPVDLVLTDLQMPHMDGFELIAWLLSNQPHIAVFTMTAHLDGEAAQRLRGLGGIDCFPKPLEVPLVLDRMARALASVQGHLRNISLPAVLQLIEMERKTCTLTIGCDGKMGQLFIDEGTLVHARSDCCLGEDAAIEIATWEQPEISILGTCTPSERTVQRPLRFIIMEAVRVQDEAARASQQFAEAPVGELDLGLDDLDLEVPNQGHIAAAASQKHAGVPTARAEFVAQPPSASDALAAIEVDSGRILTEVGAFSGLQEVAELLARLYVCESTAVSQLGIDEEIHELVVTTERYWALIRPVVCAPGNIAVVVFDPERANLMMQRRELDGFVTAFEGWLGQAAP